MRFEKRKQAAEGFCSLLLALIIKRSLFGSTTDCLLTFGKNVLYCKCKLTKYISKEINHEYQNRRNHQTVAKRVAGDAGHAGVSARRDTTGHFSVGVKGKEAVALDSLERMAKHAVAYDEAKRHRHGERYDGIRKNTRFLQVIDILQASAK